jgi:hypothetical protein
MRVTRRRSNAIHYTIEICSVPTRSRTWTRTLGESCALRYTIGTFHTQSRRLDSHQHQPVYKTGASLFGHVGSCAPGPQAGSEFFDQASNFTFQYDSLRNFPQLSIRTG